MTQQITKKISSKSSLQDKELRRLRLKKRKLIDQLSVYKNKLEEFKQSVKNSIQQSPQTQVLDFVESVFMKYASTMTALLDEVLKSKRLNQKQRKQVLKQKKLIESDAQEIKGECDEQIDLLNSMMEELRQRQIQIFEESESQEFHSLDKELQKFSIETNEVERKDIRALYLEIIKQFHPDKFQGSELEDKHHELTQQANLAYQMNDYEVLINLREKFIEPTIAIDFTEIENVHEIDNIQKREIAIIQKELNILESQLMRVKEELKQLKKSEFGALHKDSQMHEKEKKEKLTELEAEMKPIQDGLNEFLAGGEFPDYLFEDFEENEFLPIHLSPDEMEVFLQNLSISNKQKTVSIKAKSKKIRK